MWADIGDTEDEVLAYDSLNSYFGELDPLEFLYQRITQCILSEDEISDDASSALKDIRREIKQTNISIHNKLTSSSVSPYSTACAVIERRRAISRSSF